MGLPNSPKISQPAPKLRVLCLHGFRTNGDIMETQMGKWDRRVLDLLDMVFPDAPYPAEGKSDVEGIFPPPYYEWFQFRRTETHVEYCNLEECTEYISELVAKHGPFDGLIGFSQGAFLSAALASLQEKGHVLASSPPLRFTIIISGGVLSNSEQYLKDCYSKPIKCPSVHLIGEKDFLKPSNEELLKCFENPVVIRHGARHTVPRLGEDEVATIQEFLLNMSSSTEGCEC